MNKFRQNLKRITEIWAKVNKKKKKLKNKYGKRQNE